LSVLYLDTSAVLRAVLEHGTSPELAQRIRNAHALLTSRLALVETARAFHRLRAEGGIAEERLADAERHANALWSQCEIWELTNAVCTEAAAVAPRTALRTLDAIHLATYLIARRHLSDVELVTADRRLETAAGGRGDAR